jgi:glycosyltransferase involved in cell wall biosynthesis
MTRPRWAFVHPFQLRLRRGIESYLWGLTSALASTGVDVDILTWTGPLGPLNGNGSKVVLRAAPSFGYYEKHFATPYYLGQFLLRGYDHVLVDFAGYGEGPALAVVNLLKKTPFSVVFHFPRTLVPHRYEEFSRWGFPRHAEHLIGVSDFVGRQVEDWAHRSCAIIGHGVDTRRFHPDRETREKTRRLLALSDEQHLLLTAAALEERKGIQTIIRALPAVLAAFPNTHYIVLGDGPYLSKLETLVQDLKLERHVTFRGVVDDVENYLCAADVALLLSNGEANPVALLEYAASALPVITSKWPPFDALVQVEWGRTVEEADSSQVAETIGELLGNDEERNQMGAAARSWAEANHSWGEIACQYRELIG